MNKLLLALLSYPMLVAPMMALFFGSQSVHAREYVFEAPTAESSCPTVPSRMGNLNCQRLGNKSMPNYAETYLPADAEVELLDFTDEESEAAIAQFGCDCMVCINAIRQSRGLPPLL